MLTLAALGTTIGIQIFSGAFNYRRSVKHGKKIKALQQEFEQTLQQEGIKHAWEKLYQLQDFQRNFEAEIHNDRIKKIGYNFEEEIALLAYNSALNNFPLRVPPFVMKGESINIGTQEESTVAVALHCILCRSNDANFNSNIYKILENNLSRYFTRYWGTSSSHPVLFYSGAWKNVEDIGVEVENIKTHIANLPTLIISPWIPEESGPLQFKVSLWGIPNTDEMTNEIVTPEKLTYTYQQNQRTYSDNDKKHILNELTPLLQAFISYIADQYYWAWDKVPPLLPSLLAKEIVPTQGNRLLEEYKDLYLKMFNKYVVEDNEINRLNMLIDSINSVKLLGSIKTVINNEKVQSFLHEVLLKTCELRGFNYRSLSVNEIFAKEELPLETLFIQEFRNLYAPIKSISKRITINNNNNNSNSITIMDSRTYQQKRDELIAIMGKILKIDGLGEKNIKEFQSIMKKSKENQFKITLIGEFQGGKSTTFDAFCDGREISPRGANIKTSACKITATNISEEGKDEYAFVNWKSDSELIQSIETIFELYIEPTQLGFVPESDNTEDKNRKNFEYSNYLSFSNPEHIKLMKDAIQKEWNRLDGRNDEDDRLDILRIADIILHFYNNSDVKELKKKTTFSITDVAKFAVFPERWKPRWIARDVSVFKAEEVLFAFVAGIDCYIHSKNLERLGCTIIDCPGLFTSKWDTRVAFETLPESDAILYLLGGDKQMRDGDKKAITEILTKGIPEEKIFFAINTREGANKTANILETDISILRDTGFKSEKLSISQYNAQLFFLAEFGATYLKKKDEYFVERFKKMMSFMLDMKTSASVEDLWIESANDSIQRLNIRGEIIKKMDNATIIRLKELSGASNLFDNIEKHILENRAYSILIDTGAGQAKAGIDAIEQDLLDKERDATKTLMQCEEEIKNAQKALQEFQSQSRSILDKAFPDRIFSTMLEHGYRAILEKNIETICVKSTFKLCPILKTWDAMRAVAHSKERRQEEIKKLIRPIIEPVVEGEISKSLSVWITSINRGEDVDYKEHVNPELDRIKMEIGDKWNAIAMQCEYIKSIPIRLPSNVLRNIKIDIPQNVYTTKDIIDETQGVIISGIVSDVIRTVVGYVAGVVTIFVLDMFLTLGLATVIGIIIEILIIGGGGNREEVTSVDDLKKKEKKLYEELKNAFNEMVQKDKTRNDVIDKLKKIPNSITKTYTTYYEEKFEEQETKLNNKITETRNNKKESVEKQKQIAEAAKLKRENKIIPVSKDLQSFINSVIQLCKKNGK
jgi:hypothetical protein